MRSKDEIQKWRDEDTLITECRKKFDKTSQNYQINEYSKDIDGWLKEVADEFGMDRIKQVVAATMASRNEDGRFSKEAREWVEKISILKPTFDTAHNEIFTYASNLHSGWINLVAERLKKLENSIKIVTISPLLAPKVDMVENHYKQMQNIVGGLIEVVPFDNENPNIRFVCNEEGKLDGLTGNRQIGDDIIAGTFFITKTGEDGEFVSLSDDEILKYMLMFKEVEHYTTREVENAIYCEVLTNFISQKETALINKLEDEYLCFKEKALLDRSEVLFERAYEITIVTELYNMLTEEHDFGGCELDTLLDHKINVLQSLYDYWMETDYNISQTLEDFLDDFISGKSFNMSDINQEKGLDNSEEIEL